MRKMLLVLVLGLAVLAFVAAGCGGDDEEGAGTTETTTETTDTGGETGAENELLASVGPGFEISMTTADGDAVTSVPAGEYKIEVNDQSDIHNFHLTGPGGVDQSTTVEETGETTWTVTLEAGDYDYICDPHASSMNGSFTVTG